MSSRPSPKILVNEHGYQYFKLPDGRVVYVHRYVAEQSIRPLRKGEQVHHKNGVRTDNRPANLQIVTKRAHETLHRAYREAKKVKDKSKRKYEIRACPYCRNTFAREKRKLVKDSACSKECAARIKQMKAQHKKINLTKNNHEFSTLLKELRDGKSKAPR